MLSANPFVEAKEGTQAEKKAIYRQFISYFVPLFLILTLFMAILLGGDWLRTKNLIDTNEELQVKLIKNTLTRDLENIAPDLHLLLHNNSFNNFLNDPTADNLSKLQQSFSLFATHKQLYQQVRFIDTAGEEVVRIDYKSGKVVTVTGPSLQNKGNRYYFKESIALQRGAIFVSPIDLNVEHGLIEQPYQPMIRFATPVFDHTGTKRGILILNYLAERMLLHFDEVTSGTWGHIELLNKDGYWIRSHKREREWGFMLPHNRHFSDKHGEEAWSTMRQTEAGRIDQQDGIYSYVTLNPVAVTMESLKNVPDFHGVFQQNSNLGWKIVSDVETQVMYRRLLENLIYISGPVWTLLIILSLIGSWRLATHKIVQQQLQHEAELHAKVFAWTTEGITITDTDANILDVNNGFSQITGYTPEDVVGKNSNILSSGQHDAAFYHQLWAELANRGFWEGEIYNRGKAGNIFCEWLRINTVYDHNKRPVNYVAIFSDITKRRARENELQQNREMLNIAQEIAKIGSWDWDIIEDELYWSLETYRILGLEPKEGKTHYEAFLTSIHSDDREYVVTAINESTIIGKPFALEFQIVRPDGEIRIIKGQAEVTHNEDGKAVRMVGTIHDITELKQAEYELAMSDNVFNTAAEGIMVTDRSNRILRVNRAFSNITQYSEEEVIGLHPQRLLQSGRHDPEFYQSLWHTLNSEDHWSGEIWNLRKDGELFASHQNITVVRNVHGNIVQHISIFSDITERKRAEEDIRYLAHFDQLTGLHNRVLFKDRFEHAIAKAARVSGNVGLLFIDLDRFKFVNDNLGHDAGDQLLIQVSHILKQSVRKQDTVARLGGDEFTIILEDLESASDAAKVADQIIQSISKPLDIHQHEVVIGSSIGISIFPDNGLIPEELIKYADIAMYHAKESGRNQYQYYTTQLAEQSNHHFYLQARMRNALQNGEFELYYHPQIAIDGSRIIGAEALIRWNDPEHGVVSPSAFIPIAEETGLIAELGIWVLEAACLQAEKWCREYDPDFCISVNLSAKQLMAEDIFEKIESVIERSGLSPHNLELEVTETAVMENPEHGIHQLERLRALGVLLSIDDFGTGYSSLSYLKRLPITRVKIDRSFLVDANENRDDAMIVRAIIQMAISLELRVIAEGVEREEQIEFLLENGCSEYQGYYYSMPVQVSAFENLLVLQNTQ